MANFNEAIRWVSSERPPIYLTVTYGKYRSGADMVYSVGLSISTVTGQYWFGYPIYAQIYVNGEGSPRYSVTLKNASPSQWSSNINYNTGNFVVSNKTTGTTGLAVRLYSGSGSSRDETYYFDMGVDPAYFTSTPTLTYKNRTETSITYNWSTSEICDSIVWHGTGTVSTTGLPGTSGTVTFTGLTADTSYTHYGTFRRQDSQLSSDSNRPTSSTDKYPYVTSVLHQQLVIGQSQNVNVYNPYGRSVTVYVKANNTSGTTLYSKQINGTTTGEFTLNAADLYNLIPSSPTGNLVYYCVYDDIEPTIYTGTFIVNGSEKPTFPTSSWSYAANLTALTNDNQIIIDKYSSITITINTPANSDYNASITGYSATWGSASTPTPVSGSEPITLSQGNGTSIVVLANDSRGLQSDLQTSTLDVTNNRVLYNKPVVNVLETHRLNGIDTTVTLNASGIMFNSTFGATGVQNAIDHVNYYVKPTNSSTWSQAYPISLNNCTFDSTTGRWEIVNASIHQNGQSGGFPQGSSFNIKLEFYDAQGLLGYGTATSTIEDGTLARDVFKDSDGEYHEGVNGLADGDYTQTIHGKVNVTGGYYLNGEPFEGGGGDTLPYGVIVDYDGDTVPDGYEEVISKQYEEYVLYNNTSGNSGNVTLSDSTANYDYIEIFYRDVDAMYGSVKVYEPNNKKIRLSSAYIDGTSFISKEDFKQISNNIISDIINGEAGITDANRAVNWGTIYTVMYITRVVGYKEV